MMTRTVAPRWAADGWTVRKIAVVGPGIVGMPMAALLAAARVRIGREEPAPVVVVQRPSATSGWKVAAINAGRSPIGGVEPELAGIVADAVGAGLLSATHDPLAVADADAVVVCTQTDRRGLAPDYDPLFGALDGVIEALRRRPADGGPPPLVILESTLAPSSMQTVVRDRFRAAGLEDGRDVRLANSPNRVMPGRLAERVRHADKLVGALDPDTTPLVARLYAHAVTMGALHETNSLTAEVVKTLENAYRDVRIAFASELVRWCDTFDMDFYALRDAVNARLAQADRASADPHLVPTGGVLVPTLGVGGHCLPKDGILLWWRALEAGVSDAASVVLEARRINDEAPAVTLRAAERRFGSLSTASVAILGMAYRPESEDTRNSPSLVLARLLRERGCTVRLHDPYVRTDDQNLRRTGFDTAFTDDLDAVLARADIVVVACAHRDYLALPDRLRRLAPRLRGVVDACHAYGRGERLERAGITAMGIGYGRRVPPSALVEFVVDSFRAMERGVACEVAMLADFLSERYAARPFDRVEYEVVRRLAGTCPTGCRLGEPVRVEAAPEYEGFAMRLPRRAAAGTAAAAVGVS
ncbi:MAG TPA: nucleotide sugar dehydrogenase [Gemmatimonadaceae bacterium]|nr:nucleotide sugar dehydrogenase [Gemmatimonadaceae bacterium]